MSGGAGAVWLPPPDDAEVAGRLGDAFRELHGRPADGVWAAPGRVNLIGEHTDYNQGLCLPLALEHRTYAAAGLRTDRTIRVASLQQDGAWGGQIDEVGPGRPRGWQAYPLGVLWALQRKGVRVPGVDLLVDGRVPLGSGLSSSAALECSVAVAVADLVPEAGELSRAELAAACVEAENVVAGASTGGLDQTISLRGRAGHAMLLDCRDFSIDHVPWTVGAEGWVLLVMDTRVSHTLVDGQYAERRNSCQRAAVELGVASLRDVPVRDLPEALDRLSADHVLVRRTRHVVTEIERVRAASAALQAGDVASLGGLMTASHVSLRDDYEVSCAELDLAVEAALGAGAAGARMTGGGFGGSAIALVPHAEANEVAATVARAFEDRGWQPPHVLEAQPGGPAQRVH